MPNKMKGKSPLPLAELTAISPLDGRYRERVADLVLHVSEFGLIRTRFEVESKYLIALSEAGVIRSLTTQERKTLEDFGQNLTLVDAQKVKEIEAGTKHDVKAVERAFRMFLGNTSLKDLIEMIHLALTSEDVNNLAYRLMLLRGTHDVCLPIVDDFVDQLVLRAKEYKDQPMLARTHGQAAVPTTVGKELINFAVRINRQTRELESTNLTGKVLGAVGNLNAFREVNRKINWLKFSQDFVKSLGLTPNLIATQINPYEDVIAYFQNYQRINGVFLDFDIDMWRYISDDWFMQLAKEGEVGSSTMPQKVNPIDFENSEGNLTMANGVLETISRTLGQSRLQRDLSDSTLIRNLGIALGYSLLGYGSAANGFMKVRPNLSAINEDLNQDWSILTEAVQVVLRKEGVEDSYSLVASIARGKRMSEQDYMDLIDKLPVEQRAKDQLRVINPQNYLGFAVELVNEGINEIKSSRKGRKKQ